MRTERDFALGDGDTMQCADEVWLSCTLETFMGLLTNVTPNEFNKTRQTNHPKHNFFHKLHGNVF